MIRDITVENLKLELKESQLENMVQVQTIESLEGQNIELHQKIQDLESLLRRTNVVDLKGRNRNK